MLRSEGAASREDKSEKPRLDLLCPYVLERDGHHFRNGADRYGDRNWEDGLSESDCMRAIMSHWCAQIAGDQSEDHLAAMRWNAGAIISQEERRERGVFHIPSDLPHQNILVPPIPTTEQTFAGPASLEEISQDFGRRISVYLGSPMRGFAGNNHELLHEVSRELVSSNVGVFNPARDDEEHGLDPEHALSGGERRAAIERDSVALTSADAAVFLPNWEQSAGAKGEVATALSIGIPLFEFDLGTRIVHPMDVRISITKKILDKG